MKKYLTVLCVIALLGAGCSPSATPSSTPTAAVNPETRCDALMTLDEAKLITGLAYAQRDVKVDTLGKIVVTSCTFHDGGSKSGIKPFNILTRYASTVDEAKTIFESSKTASYTDGQALSGLGEQALWSQTFGQVSVLQGQTWLIVGATNNKELATKIAGAVAPKLK
ncbi:hypothetical protein K8R04_01875 [Candidatus Uhrbacteria bacterium]|nr:hypothetical protein [Candidatus Uhrbacteria bacterium]